MGFNPAFKGLTLLLFDRHQSHEKSIKFCSSLKRGKFLGQLGGDSILKEGNTHVVKFHCFNVHFNSLNFTQLMDFYIYIIKY